MNRVLVIASALFLFSSVARADEDKNDDFKFVKEVHQSGIMEIQVGKLAPQRSQNAAIKKLADRLVQDHGRMVEELQAFGRKKSIALPKELTSDKRDMVEKLAKLKGAEFDQAFSRMAIASHEKSIEKFEKEIKSGRDPEITAWAQKKLPAIREHLAMARSTLTAGH